MLRASWPRTSVAAVAIASLLALPAAGQMSGPTAPTSTNPNKPSTSATPNLRRPIVITGRVRLEDGSPVPRDTVIERVCYGYIHQEARTDSAGEFSFQLEVAPQILPDATVSESVVRPNSQQADDLYPGAMPGGLSNAQGGAVDARLANCELRANATGFRSSRINLARFQSDLMINVGTIFLEHGEKSEGTTVSATGLGAPKDARKAFQKGMEEARKGKLDDAIPLMQKAVTSFPRYAQAWFELGQLLRQQKQLARAKDAYSQSIAADSNFVLPYLALAELALLDRQWSEVLAMTSRALTLDSLGYPAAYYYDAMANYKLGNLPQAEKSALRAQLLDQQNRLPRLHLLLASISANRGDYTGAIAQLKTYLALAPTADDAAAIRSKIVDLEKLSASVETRSKAEPKPN